MPTLEDYNAQNRLRAIQGLYQQYPGRMAGGTGETGLAKNDSHGWSDMLNEQQEYEQLTHPDKPLQVRYHGDFDAHPKLAPTFNPAFQQSAADPMPGAGSALAGLQQAAPGGAPTSRFRKPNAV